MAFCGKFWKTTTFTTLVLKCQLATRQPDDTTPSFSEKVATRKINVSGVKQHS